MEDIYKYLKRVGKTEISVKAQQGDELCLDIIKYYDMHYKCPGDPGGQALVTDKVVQYIRQQRQERGAWPAEAPLSLRYW